MAGGFVSGRKFNTDSEYKSAIEDAELVAKIKSQTNLKDPNEVNRLYASMQAGEFRFKTIVGRDFDDEIYELAEYYKTHTQSTDSNSNSKKNKKLFGANSRNNHSNTTSQKNSTSNKINTTSNKTSRNTIKLESDVKSSTNISNTAIRHNTSSVSIDIDKTIEKAAQELIKKRNRIRRSIIGISLLIAIGSFVYFGIYYKQAMEAQAAYDELANLKGTTPIVENIEQKPLFTLAEDEKMPEILDEYKNIYLKNKSIVGWIKIDDTNIDYPVMQTVNNDYYLKHDFEGKDDNNGALFVDCQCNIPFRSTNIIIYGHHMKSGKMFGQLKKYSSEDYCKEHNIIQFDTIYEKGTYEVMYVFEDDIRNAEDISFKYYQFIDAVSENEFYSNLNEMSKMSLYDTGVEAEYGDDLLTLSTCSGSTSTKRFVVVAKRVSGRNVSKTVNMVSD